MKISVIGLTFFTLLSVLITGCGKKEEAAVPPPAQPVAGSGQSSAPPAQPMESGFAKKKL